MDGEAQEHYVPLRNITDFPTVRITGLDIVNSQSSPVTERMLAAMRGKAAHMRVCFVNAHCSNISGSNPDYRKALRSADALLPDGSGIGMAFRMNGSVMLENLNGTDFVPHLCRMISEEGYSVFLLGGKPGVAEAAAAGLLRIIPELRIAGTHHGYLHNESDNSAVISLIRNSGASLLLVAMGVPLQDIWLRDNAERIGVPVVMGVGGLFDFLAERVSRAPYFLRRAGLEWTWRFIQEPGRMWRRYLLGNPLFIFRAAMDALNRSRSLKRTMDIFGGLFLLAGAAVPIMLAALAVKLTSPGPAILKQIRIGENGKPFTMYKLRSMYTGAGALKESVMSGNQHGNDILFKMKRDPRITPVGSFLRRTSLDELPQLWNVVNGTMSLVGPRPNLPREVAMYEPHHHLRLNGKPGITCLWQVSGRANLPFPEQYRLDMEYLNRRSFIMDLRILLHTPLAVLRAHGAY